jgi:hypothetical protein
MPSPSFNTAMRALAFGLQLYPHRGTGPRMLHGVVQQVGQGTPEQRRIDAGGRITFDAQGQPGILEQEFKEVPGGGHFVGQRHRPGLHGDVALPGRDRNSMSLTMARSRSSSSRLDCITSCSCVVARP